MTASPGPRVSILMPVRNEERYLSRAIDSILGQSWRDWELVAVDDGSTDATARILAEAAAADSRIRVLDNPAGGLVSALNHGLAACRAPLVARMDGDDVSHPKRLATQVGFMEESPGTDLLACSFRHFPRHGIKGGMLAYEQWQNALLSHEQITADLFVESPFVHPSVIYRRDRVVALGGYRDMGWAEDYDLWLRLAASGARFARIGAPLFFWRDHPERATRTMAEYTLEAFRECKACHLRTWFLKGCDRVILAGAGKEGRAWRRTLAANGIGVHHWVDVDPRKTGKTLHGAEILTPDRVSPDGVKMLVTVGTRGARDGIRDWARNAGFIEGEDFICVT